MELAANNVEQERQNLKNLNERREYNKKQGRSYDDWMYEGREKGLARAIEKSENLKELIASARDFVNRPRIDKLEISKRFEENGWDVSIEASGKFRNLETAFISVAAELKLALGDDYPAVLRKMKAQSREAQSRGYYCHMRLLILDEFTAAGATLEQVKEIFRTSGFDVVTLKEIETRSPSRRTTGGLPPDSG